MLPISCLVPIFHASKSNSMMFYWSELMPCALEHLEHLDTKSCTCHEVIRASFIPVMLLPSGRTGYEQKGLKIRDVKYILHWLHWHKSLDHPPHPHPMLRVPLLKASSPLALSINAAERSELEAKLAQTEHVTGSQPCQ